MCMNYPVAATHMICTVYSEEWDSGGCDRFSKDERGKMSVSDIAPAFLPF